MAPSLQSVLSSKYCGIIRAVWGCEEGHNYIMSTDSDCSTLLVDSALAVQWELKKDSPQHVTGNGVASDSSGAAIPSLQPQHSAARAVAGQQLADSGIALPASSAENLVPESRGLPSLQDPLQEDLLQATCPRSGSPGKRVASGSDGSSYPKGAKGSSSTQRDSQLVLSLHLWDSLPFCVPLLSADSSGSGGEEAIAVQTLGDKCSYVSFMEHFSCAFVFCIAFNFCPVNWFLTPFSPEAPLLLRRKQAVGTEG